MYGVPLRVERTFYVDSDLPLAEATAALGREGAHVSPAKKTLPHSVQAGYLYQARMTMPNVHSKKRHPGLLPLTEVIRHPLVVEATWLLRQRSILWVGPESWGCRRR